MFFKIIIIIIIIIIILRYMPAKKEWTNAHEKRLSQLTSYIKNYVKPDIGEDWLLKYNKKMLMTK